MAVGEGWTSTYHNGVRHFFLDLARRVAFRGWRQETLVVPFLVLDAKAHNVALVEEQLCVIVAPDVDLFILFAVRIRRKRMEFVGEGDGRYSRRSHLVKIWRGG
jgi:hypothetical protein